MSKVIKDYLKDIQNDLDIGYNGSSFTSISRVMPDGVESFNLAIISGVNFGSHSKHKADLKKLIYHIQELAEDPNALVILNGELTSFIPGKDAEIKAYDKYNYAKQISALVEIFKPIKDKIIAVANGETENKILKKDGFNILEQICIQLGIEKTFTPDSYDITITLKNEYTGNRPMNVTIIGEYGNGVTNTLRTANTKNLNLSRRLRNADIVVTSVSKVPMISRELTHKSTGKTDNIEKKPIIFIVSGNYRKYTDVSIRKKLAPYYTDNYYYPVFIARNLDYVNVRGTGQISEPFYKIYTEQMNFGLNKDYTKEYKEALIKYKFEKEFDSTLEELIKSLKDEAEIIKEQGKKVLIEELKSNSEKELKNKNELQTKDEKEA